MLGRAASASLRRWPLALALYVPGAALAFASAVPIFFAAVALESGGPWVAEIAEGGLANVLLEVAAAGSSRGALGEPPAAAFEAAGAGAVAGLAGAPVAVLLQGLAYTFVSGGVLARLVGGREAPFLPVCRRWFWPMLRFGALALLVLVVLAGLGLAAIAVSPGGGASVVALKALAAVAWVGCVDGLLETARADMVARDDPSALGALGRAFGLVVRTPLLAQAVLLWLALAALGGVLSSVAVVALAGVPALALLAAALVQQGLALLGAWLKLIRLAVAVELSAWPAAQPGGRRTLA